VFGPAGLCTAAAVDRRPATSPVDAGAHPNCGPAAARAAGRLPGRPPAPRLPCQQHGPTVARRCRTPLPRAYGRLLPNQPRRSPVSARLNGVPKLFVVSDSWILPRLQENWCHRATPVRAPIPMTPGKLIGRQLASVPSTTPKQVRTGGGGQESLRQINEKGPDTIPLPECLCHCSFVSAGTEMAAPPWGPQDECDTCFADPANCKPPANS